MPGRAVAGGSSRFFGALARWYPGRPATGGGAAGAAAAVVAALPAYQVALWPDGWVLARTGEVAVRDTHAMAEARRWYRLADRSVEAPSMDRTMRIHGIFVPRPVVALAGHRFPSEAVASVALRLAAGDWIGQRRRQLLAAPDEALRAQGLGWTGSRHSDAIDTATLTALVTEVLADCLRERLIPRTRYDPILRPDDGFGIRGYRCILVLGLDPAACANVRDAMCTALVPWNRAVVYDGRVYPLIRVEVRRRR